MWGRNRAEMKNNGWTSENKECAGDKWWSGREGKRRGQREREEGCRTRWRMRGRATGPAGRRACRRQSALTDGDADSPGRTLARLHH